MSVVTITNLPNVRGRMDYTHFGEGKQYRENKRNGVVRAVNEMGDARDAFSFVWECEQQHLRHPKAKYEGFELMFSWSKDEMNPANPDDVARCMEFAYLASHEVQPSCKVWVTMHTDGSESAAKGELGPIHAHVTVMNHDFVTGKCIQHGMTVPRIRAINDNLSRDYGFDTLSDVRGYRLWEDARKEVKDKFTLLLGDTVMEARNASRNLPEFHDELGKHGIELMERKKKLEDGTEAIGWMYKMLDTVGPRSRTRRRNAAALSDDLSKDGIEEYFATAPERREELVRQQAETARKQAQAVQKQAQAEAEQAEAQAEEVAYAVDGMTLDIETLKYRWRVEDNYLRQGMSASEAAEAADKVIMVSKPTIDENAAQNGSESLTEAFEDEVQVVESEEDYDPYDYDEVEFTEEEEAYWYGYSLDDEDDDDADEDVLERADEPAEQAKPEPELKITFKDIDYTRQSQQATQHAQAQRKERQRRQREAQIHRPARGHSRDRQLGE